MLQTVEEIADVGADAGSGARELSLKLLQLPKRGVELALLLGCLIQLDFEDGVAQAGDFLQHHARAHAQRSLDDRVAGGYIGNLPGVSGGVRVGHVVGRGGHLLLADRKPAQGNRKRPEQTRHSLFSSPEPNFGLKAGRDRAYR